MWYLDYWKPKNSESSQVEKDIRKIRDKVRLQQLRKLVRLIEKFGPHLPMPNNKNLKGGLFELRDSSTGARYYYCETDFIYEGSENKKVILLLLVAGLQKDRQPEDIELARSRMNKIDKRNVLNEGNFEILGKD